MDKNNLPENLNSYPNSTKKGIPIKLIIAIIIFTGSLIFSVNRLINSNREPIPTEPSQGTETESEYIEGSIKYVSPSASPGEGISYRLIDPEGKHIIYLKSDDAKLEVSENLYVKIKGSKSKTESKEDVLLVDEIIVSR